MAARPARVTAPQVSAFYEQDAQTSIVRLCFAKADTTLDEGARRLGTMLR